MALHIPTLLVVSVFIFFLMSLLTFHAVSYTHLTLPTIYSV